MSIVTTISAEEQRARDRLLARLPAMRAAALGQSFKVEHTTPAWGAKRPLYTVGEIVDVKHAGWYHTARSVGMLFEVSMLCGTARVLRTFTVRRIPG